MEKAVTDILHEPGDNWQRMAILAPQGTPGPVTTVGRAHGAWICQKSAETVGEPLSNSLSGP